MVLVTSDSSLELVDGNRAGAPGERCQVQSLLDLVAAGGQGRMKEVKLVHSCLTWSHGGAILGGLLQEAGFALC